MPNNQLIGASKSIKCIHKKARLFIPTNAKNREMYLRFFMNIDM